jgi:hypothetical protein
MPSGVTDLLLRVGIGGLMCTTVYSMVKFPAWALILPLAALAVAARPPQSRPPADFRALASQLVAARDSGAEESQVDEEQALAMLDRAVLEQLNAPKPAPDLTALNARLASFVTHEPPLGEGYRLAQLGGQPPTYALLANFSLRGPSAVRVYAGRPGSLALAGRVDRYAQKNFFDDYMELVAIAGADPVFVTVSGRTDDLHTGVFTAWYFADGRVNPVWASEILQQSSYEAAPDGFRLTYCADTDAQDLRECHTMQRDRYIWQDRTWKRGDSTTVPASAPQP